VSSERAPWRDTLATLLLTRVLRMMRLEGGVKAALINETVAYQLVWPD
jgi:hypothetical protein